MKLREVQQVNCYGSSHKKVVIRYLHLSHLSLVEESGRRKLLNCVREEVITLRNLWLRISVSEPLIQPTGLVCEHKTGCCISATMRIFLVRFTKGMMPFTHALLDFST